jgi:two-component system chemotaxis response regulator CheB
MGRSPSVPVVPRRGGRGPRLVAIGSSTGGPTALMQLFGAFPEPPPCGFVLSQHMPEGFTAGFAHRLDRYTAFHAREARSGDRPEAGTILVAPGGHHLELESLEGRTVVRLAPQTASDRYAPSVDRMFASAAKHFGRDLLAVVLTGMGDDGRYGAALVREAGGRVIAESEETAVIFGMPAQVIRAGAADAVLPLPEIPRAIQAGLPAAEEKGAEGPR